MNEMMSEYQQKELQIAMVSCDTTWMCVASCYFAEQDAFGQGDYYVNGKQLLAALLKGLTAQVIVLDEQMRDMDLRMFMEEYATLPLANRPILIGMGNKRYLGYTGALFSLGLTDFMTKPVQLTLLAQRMLKLYYEKSSDSVKLFCEKLYQDWQIECCESTMYLTDAIKLVHDTPEKQSIRKDIYWNLSQLHGCSREAVDSSLRRFIQRLEEKSTPSYLAFKIAHGAQNKKMSVSKLIPAMKQEFDLYMEQNCAQKAALEMI